MVSNKKQLEFGYAGLALLKNRLVGKPDVAEHIVKEISALIKDLKEDPASSAEKIKRYSVASGYKSWADTYDDIPNLLINVEEPVVKSILARLKKGRALDAACGTGRYSQILHDLGHSVTGVDSSPEMLKQAKKRVPVVDFLQGDLEKLPVKSRSFDLAIAALTLTHFPSIERSVRELNRAVCNGGRIILSDIHPWSVLVGGQAEFQNLKGEKGYIFNYVHHHGKYIKVFNELGLKVKQCLEPVLDPKHISFTETRFGLSKQTMNTALIDLPIVLIWVLEKP